jgi:hypothetical protein
MLVPATVPSAATYDDAGPRIIIVVSAATLPIWAAAIVIRPRRSEFDIDAAIPGIKSNLRHRGNRNEQRASGSNSEYEFPHQIISSLFLFLERKRIRSSSVPLSMRCFSMRCSITNMLWNKLRRCAACFLLTRTEFRASRHLQGGVDFNRPQQSPPQSLCANSQIFGGGNISDVEALLYV